MGRSRVTRNTWTVVTADFPTTPSTGYVDARARGAWEKHGGTRALGTVASNFALNQILHHLTQLIHRELL